MSGQSDERPLRVNRWIDLLASYAWRLLLIAAAVVGALWVIAQTWVVFAALAVAVLLTRALAAPCQVLAARAPRSVAAGASVLGFLVVASGVVAGISVAVAGEVSRLGPTVSSAVDDIERWVSDRMPVRCVTAATSGADQRWAHS